ncbi:hypothetical protein BC830DRAFT_933033 [Chytriomyces sp. MP71]|nr:hypothetical protein BC830DRAFT_933033 [Chytriomyces sp. MP71]
MNNPTGNCLNFPRVVTHAMLSKKAPELLVVEGAVDQLHREPAEVSVVPMSTPSTPVINDPHAATIDRYDFAVHDYSHIFSRSPPHGFNTWLQMALKDKCITTFEAYAQIYKDLQPWFARSRIHRTDLELPPGRTVNRHSYANGSDFFKWREGYAHA